jgi:hypothetical protein
MAGVKISNLPAATTPLSGSETFPVVQSGTTKKATFSDIPFVASGSGAVSRTVQGKLRDFISVKDFGAVGDGVTDDYPAFEAAINSLSAIDSYVGGEIIIPSGTYYLSQTWNIKKRVTIRGTNAGDQPQTAACTLLFPANTDGLRFYSNIDSGIGTDGTMSVLSNVQVRAAAKASTGVGIKSTTSIRIEHCIVRDFKSHGIEIHGQTGVGATGVADFWKISNVRVVTCGGHGLYTHGNDSQVGVALQVECVANGQWGFYDESPYTSTYIACQAAGNTTGSFFHANTMSYQGGIYIGCYVEYDAGATVSLTDGCLVIGGTLNSNTATSFYNGSPGGSGINVPTSGQWMGWRNGAEVWRISNTNVFSGLPRAVFGTATDYNDIFNSNIAQVTSTSANQNRITFDTPSGRAGSIQTTGATTAYITTSDYRMKENVQPMENGLAKICKLNPVTYTWKVDGRLGQGFIAHELQEIVPDCVAGQKDAVDEDGKPVYQGVDTSYLVATLVKAVQESASKIDALEEQIKQLNNAKNLQ